MNERWSHAVLTLVGERYVNGERWANAERERSANARENERRTHGQRKMNDLFGKPRVFFKNYVSNIF